MTQPLISNDEARLSESLPYFGNALVINQASAPKKSNKVRRCKRVTKP